MRHIMDNGTAFMSPYEEDLHEDSLEWKLRYNAECLTTQDMLVIASILASYRAIIMKPIRERNVILSRIKKDVLETWNDIYT